jgi:hypothetical protein
MGSFKKYVDILAEGGGMSEDEPDPGSTTSWKKGPRKYFVIRPVWRSQEVTDWLRTIDLVYLDTRFAADGRPMRGRWVRDRIRSTKVDQAAQPINGLPLNFYDKAWLASLSTKRKRRLEIQGRINLDHTEGMMR